MLVKNDVSGSFKMDTLINKALACIVVAGPGGENLMTQEDDDDEEIAILLQTLKVSKMYKLC